MWTWLMTPVSLWLAWFGSYYGSKVVGDAVASVLMPYGAILGAVLCFLFVLFGRDDSETAKEGFWKRTGFALLGALVGGVVGVIVGFVLTMTLPIMVALVAAAAVLTVAAALFLRGPHLALTGWATLKRSAARLHWPKGRKHQVKDRLADLDASAQDVARQLNELKNQHDATNLEAEHTGLRLKEVMRLRAKMADGTASAEITDDLTTRFQKNAGVLNRRLAKLALIIGQIETGQREMSDLIALARLCRQAGEASMAEDTRALDAARKALDALRRAFEQADAVLSAAVGEVPEMDMELAFRQLGDGVERNAQLAAAAQAIEVSAPARVRA